MNPRAASFYRVACWLGARLPAWLRVLGLLMLLSVQAANGELPGQATPPARPTPPVYLYTGQQFDPDLGLYYLRARYHNPDSGRFWTADAFEGFASDPASLHRYTYCHNNPVNAVDPSGYSASLGEGMTVLGLGPTVTSALFATSLGMASRGAGALSGGAGFMDMVEAAADGTATDLAINLAVGGLLKGAGHCLQTMMPGMATEAAVALSRAFGALNRAMAPLEAAFAQMQTAVRAGAAEMLAVAEANLSRAIGQVSRLREVISQLRGILGWHEGEALAAKSATTTFQGLEVRAVRNLSHVDDATLRAMADRGFAPRTVNGDRIVLHHHQQNPNGFIVEMPAGNHSIWNTRQHPFGNTPGAGLTAEQRAAFNDWRVDYWRSRAQQELSGRAGGL